MEPYLESLTLALRVLAAISERRQPAAADADALEILAPDLAGAPLDELACAFVHRSLKYRAGRERGRYWESRKTG